MGKHCITAVLVWLLSVSFCCAQKGMIKAGRNLPAASRAATQSALRQLSPALMGTYGRELRALEAANRFSAKQYPRLAHHNKILLDRAVNLFVEQEKLFSSHAAEIVGNIQSRVYKQVPYTRLLPQHIDVLYIGEIHGVERVQGEIQTLVKSLRSIYPGRKIYLAAESVPAAFDGNFSAEDLLYTAEELTGRLREDADMLGVEEAEELSSFDVIRAALEEEIPVLGLESEAFILQLATPKGRAFPTPKQYEQVVTSLSGMELRNTLFAKGISFLRQFDPEALIVVYGGIDHMAYHQPGALPSRVGGKSFVVQVTVPAALHESNPLFKNFLESPEIRRAFNASPAAKLVESWKEPTLFNQVLGNDLTVIVHE